MVEQRPPTLFARVAPPAQVEVDAFRHTQVALVRSRAILDRVLNNPDVAEMPTIRDAARSGSPLEWLEENLRFEFVDRIEILLVSLPGPPTPDRATFVRRVVEGYMALVAERYELAVRHRLGRLRMIRNDFRERAEVARAHLAGRNRAAGEVGSGPGTTSLRREVLRGELDHVAHEALRVKLEAAEVDARLESLKGAGPGEATTTLEGRRTALARQGEVLDREAVRLAKKAGEFDSPGPELAGDRDEVRIVEETLRRVEAEIYAMEIEERAPPRFRIVDLPTAPRPA